MWLIFIYSVNLQVVLTKKQTKKQQKIFKNTILDQPVKKNGNKTKSIYTTAILLLYYFLNIGVY